MPRTRIRRKQRRFLPFALAGAVVLLAGWYLVPTSETVDPATLTGRPIMPTLSTDRPEVLLDSLPPPSVTEKGERPALTGSNREAATPPERKTQALIDSGRKALAADDVIGARSYFSDALEASDNPDERATLRAELTRIGNETIFSGRVFENDPLVDRYIVQSGDTLGKIAKAYHVPVDLFVEINGIRNKNVIRVGQALKAIKGPFHAVVDCEAYTMGVYLGRTFVKQFRVGLGEDNSTPRGTWKVGTKLVNPTYYPPRGGRIIPPDDPENPLGGRWIGLTGVSGEAVGQLRYGIHGTNEPESVGRSVSLGCIRLYNEDVEALYNYLIEEESTVVVR
jgi:lipoprotein-anchoring transpeptidase ErfK/SrfK